MRTITVDRIIPGIYGGKYTRDNIRPMCASCNMSIGGMLGAKRRKENQSWNHKQTQY